jgi:hypothetical protein
MARLIEIQDPAACPTPLTVRVGDMLLLRAAGGLVRSGVGCVELLGSFVSAVLGDNAEILSPMGAPSTVLVLARQPGQASIVVTSGDPFHSPQTTELFLSVVS